jgi:hypothetical protein
MPPTRPVRWTCRSPLERPIVERCRALLYGIGGIANCRTTPASCREGLQQIAEGVAVICALLTMF